MCVCERERERKRGSERAREGGREGGRERERVTVHGLLAAQEVELFARGLREVEVPQLPTLRVESVIYWHALTPSAVELIPTLGALSPSGPATPGY